MRDQTNRGVRPRLARETLRLYVRESLKMPGFLAGAYITSIIYSIGVDVLTPLFISRLIDELIRTPVDQGVVNHYFWLTVIALSASHLTVGRLTMFLRNRVLTKTERSINLLIFDTYSRQEYSYFTNNFVGSLVARAQRFTHGFKDLLDISMFALVALAVQLIGPVVILAFKAPLLAAIFIGSFFVTLLVTMLSSRVRSPAMRVSAAAGSEVTGSIADYLTNNLAVKVFAADINERQRFYGVAEKRRQKYLHQANISEIIRTLRAGVNVSLQLVTLAVLVYLTTRGKISVGTVVLVQLYVLRLEQSLWDFNRTSERIEETLADAAEMTEVIIREPQVSDVEQPINLNVSSGEIAFRSVDFRYHDATEENILFRDLSLAIPAGQKVGLVGPSGGGKTTLTKLLLRFMDIQSGAITIDGQDITQARQNDVRSSIAYVPQEPLLFHRSIKENIAYGDPSASEAEIIKAAKLAHAHDFIAKLPQGYDTLVGERGVKLSGGEKQRVAIARAMLKKSPIVVLDEATSALDSKSEKAIVVALDNLMAGRTTIVIAHRLSTIRKLDRIMVLKDGKIVEDGTHAKLLKENGLYAELWSHQSGEFLPEE
ncbi:MAG: ABC transporter ATP-binding protein/permease [Candidatus Saccharibacteria bacterium]|nr:ABC transporter ATP-binding protein/permease [Candidatus Saccharibacteria bacterium]